MRVSSTLELDLDHMDVDSQQLSLQVALYTDQDASSDIQTQTLKNIAWNVQEGNLNLKDLVRQPHDRHLQAAVPKHNEARVTDNETWSESRFSQ